jgi:hypothetical protein
MGLGGGHRRVVGEYLLCLADLPDDVPVGLGDFPDVYRALCRRRLEQVADRLDDGIGAVGM